jgi:hypothetical protein
MPSRRLPAALAALALAALGACRGGPVRGALPAGFNLQQSARYDRTTLYDYVDGGADRYLKRGFRGLVTGRYANRAGDEVTVDAYDLGAPAHAAALMAETRLPAARPLAVGDAALAHDYGVHCRRGAAYVEITIGRSDDALRAAAEAFARAACP